MKEIVLIVGNFTLFLLTGLILATLQTSFWFQTLGNFPPPQSWIPLFIYWSFYRRFSEALIFTYLLTFVILPLTMAPFSLFLFLNLFTVITSFLVKQRIYWDGPTYFMLVSGAASLFFPIGHLLFSWLLEPNPIAHFQFFEWIMRALLTSLLALPLYGLFHWFDRMTGKEIPSEVEGVI